MSLAALTFDPLFLAHLKGVFYLSLVPQRRSRFRLPEEKAVIYSHEAGPKSPGIFVVGTLPLMYNSLAAFLRVVLSFSNCAQIATREVDSFHTI